MEKFSNDGGETMSATPAINLLNRTEKVPDYYLHETEWWIKFPHSLEDLSDEEIRNFRPEIQKVLNE